MELSKNIFFNTDKLEPNTVVKVSYTGDLFQNGSEEVYIHFGFGLLWEEVSEIKMQKTELGFQAEIELKDFESLNFCFRNQDDAWDNNNGVNYTIPIEKVDSSFLFDEDNKSLSTHRKLR